MNARRLVLAAIAIVLMLTPGAATLAKQATATIDVRIWTETTAGQPVYDVCYTLETYSNTGCDENRDGNVLFQDIPYGTYRVVPSYPNGSAYHVDPFEIRVDANGADFVATAYERTGSTDLMLITRDPKTGDALTGACYELVGYSNIGCDENGDGRVEFAEIPYSTYAIRQVTTPAGHEKMDDYIVSIMPMDIDGPVSLLLVQAKTQAPKDLFNVSVVFVNADTNQLVRDPENCAQLRSETGPITLRGCDDGIVDGQVDFVHVDYDPETGRGVDVALACPWAVPAGTEPQLLWVGQSSLFLYIHVVDSQEPCT